MSKTKLTIIFIVLAAALIAPYLIGLWMSDPDYVFGGFLINPKDGNSYLAKMEIGWQGEWKFRLPYTLDPGEGAYLFLFYIFLGHLARITALPNLLVFHIARLLSAVFLVYTLMRLFKHTLKDQSSAQYTLALILALFGSGLGWISALFGGITSDFWVAEAYPFLSMYTNPHFPLGLGLLLIYFDQLISGERGKNTPLIMLLGLIVAVIQPFVLVIGAVVSTIYILWEGYENRQLKLLPAIYFIAGGGVFLLYQYWVILTDPVLSIWNAQNITSAPPLWDVLVSFSPALIGSVLEIGYLIKFKQLGKYKLFVIWLITGIVLLYFPFNLQRRFLLGYFVPCAFLAAAAVFRVAEEKIKLRKNLGAMLILLSVITNIFVLLGGINGTSNHLPLLEIHADEEKAFEWMTDHRSEAGPILASELTGMYIPARTGWRVVYGHPFETIHAEQRLKEIEAIFDGTMPAEDIDGYIQQHRLRYIFWGPREKMNCLDNPFIDLEIAYQNQTVTIYHTGVGR